MRALLLAIAPLTIGTSVAAQDHGAHHGHQPAPAPDTHQGHLMPPPLQEPVAEPPPPPSDRAAERFYSPEAMAAARAQLAKEHGGGTAWKVMLSNAEVRPHSGSDGYAWEGEAWWGGDIHRLVLKSEGEGEFDGKLESGEVQALYSRAVTAYFQLQAGLRQDFGTGPSRTYAVLGFEGLAPYWFELEGSAFLSDKGDVSARLEGAYDLRLTQRLILEPRGELNLSAQDTPELGLASGLTDAELGLRLRYEIRQEFAPYVGVAYERKLGETADLARAGGEDVEETRLVLGVRAWF